MKLKLAIVSALTISALSFPLTTNAVSADFSVRLGQPKSPTNQNNFKLTFVALDTQSERNITVKCFKKGPSDSSFVRFDSDKVMIPGGNTDYCDVNNGILNTSGSYSFYVTAEASSTVLTSSTVVVDYNTSGPSTPGSYSKDKINSCDYKIKLKTADDGKTVKVQLFRSDTLNIPVDAGAVVASLNIAPNTEGEIINSVPVCSKDYYYAIRSVDSADNASGTVGDRFTTTTTSNSSLSSAGTATQTPGAIALSGANTAIENIDVQTEDGATESGNVSSQEVDSQPSTPSVLGVTSDPTPFWKNKVFYIGLAVLVLGTILLRKKKQK